MDTDELSTEAYEGIIIEAENFHHDLTLQFGMLAASCENETDYLLNAKQLIKGLRKLAVQIYPISFLTRCLPKKIYMLHLKR